MVSDGQGGTASATVYVQVNAEPNVPPVAVDDPVATVKNEGVQFNILINDTDHEGAQLFVFGWAQPEHGSIECSYLGVCTYTPGTDFVGSDGFDYTMGDNAGGSDIGHVSITVEDAAPPANRPPVAVDDSIVMQAGNRGGAFPLQNDFDPDTDALSIADWTAPQHGTLSCVDTFCSYTPDADFIGIDSFDYTVSDGNGGTDTGTVTFDIQNSAPFADFDNIVTGKDIPGTVNVLANDSDQNFHALTVTDATSGTHGSVECTAQGLCTYAPDAGFLGTDSFEYTISDGHGGVATGFVSVTVREIIDAGPDWIWREERELTFEPIITSPNAFTCSWALGDGTPNSTECDFAHTYSATGLYTATLTVAVDGGPTVTESVEIEVLPVSEGGGGGAIGGNGDVVVGTDVTYTLNADFDRGTFLNVNHDVPHANELRLNGQLRPFPFVNIAASGRGTAIRVDANTGEILGEYLTAPDGMGRDPSRTTVDLHGNVWVANRAESGESGGESKGSVARIGLVLGGTRVDESGAPDAAGAYLAPPFAYNTCLDRDGDGRLRTSSGILDVLTWSNDGGVDTHGGVSTAEDECLINYTRVTGAYTRTIAIDPDNDVWVGGLDRDHEKLDGDTGEPIAGSQISFPACGGYGGLVDANAVLWSASGLLRYDTVAGTGECLQFSAYGLGLDPQTGHVWSTPFGSTVSEFDHDGNVLNTYPHGFSSAQGVAVDDIGNVWVAHSLAGGTTVGHVRTDGTLVGNVPLLGGSGPTGVAVDHNGKVWSANISSSDARRIDPEIGHVGGGGFATGWVDLVVDLGGGASPYNYSDMTGFVSIGATSPQGFWRVLQDAGSPGAAWSSIAWNGEPGGSVPAGTEIHVEARTADAIADLAAATFVDVVNGADPDLAGRYIEVRATLLTTDASITPALSDVHIVATVGGEENSPPELAAIGNRTVAEKVALSFTASATDPDADGLAFTLGPNCPLGTSISATSGVFSWTPTEAQGPGSYPCTITVTDDGSPPKSDSETITIAVTEVNLPPVGVADSYSGPQDTDLVVNATLGVLANDTDADGDTLAATKVGDPAHGTVVLNANGSFTYSPAAGYVGLDSFTYTASDGVASSSTTTVSLTIEKVNHAPTLAAITDQTIPEMVLFNSLILAGTDPDAETLSYSVESGPTGLTVNGTSGVVSWTPTEAQGPGDYTVAVRVTDPAGLHADRSFTIHVTEVNRDPSLAAIADRTVYPGDAVGLTASGSDPDLPANTLTYSLVSGPPGATVNPTSGAFAWTASATLGDYPVTIGVSDGVGGTAQRTFTIHVVRDTTTLTLGGDTSGQYSDKATITATLKVGSTPVSGASVSIGLGVASQIVTTNASGVASATFTIPGPAGSLGISAAFTGTPSKAPSDVSGTFTVNREDSTIVYSGDTIGLASATLKLSAIFTDSAATGFTGANPETGSGATIGDITKARISFAVYTAANCLTGSPITTLSAFVTDTGTAGDGIGTSTVNWSSASEGSFCVAISLVGATGTGTNGYYTAPPAEPAGLAVFIDTAGKVTGGGWVPMADGRGNFGFNASSTGTKVKGNLVFIERTVYQGKKAILIVKSNAIDALRTSGSTFPITATLTGKATYKFISAVDGSTLAESGNATFTATVVDTNAKAGAGDSFAIRVLDKNGVVLVDLPATTLGGGNVVAHIKK